PAKTPDPFFGLLAGTLQDVSRLLPRRAQQLGPLRLLLPACRREFRPQPLRLMSRAFCPLPGSGGSPLLIFNVGEHFFKTHLFYTDGVARRRDDGSGQP